MDEKEKTIVLLQQMQQGSHEAFDQFYEQYVPFVFAIAFSFLKNRLEAEDVCHDIFIDVFQKPDQYRPERGSVKAWLAVKTKNRCLDVLKRKKPILKEKLEDLFDHKSAEAEMTEWHVLLKAEKETLFQALKNIPKEQRKVLYGAYFEGRTQKELAQEMNLPLGTIKSLVRYGLNNLRKQKVLHSWAKSNGGGNRHDW